MCLSSTIILRVGAVAGALLVADLTKFPFDVVSGLTAFILLSSDLLDRTL